eukprot:4646377-Prymnesium_polylepis.7
MQGSWSRSRVDNRHARCSRGQGKRTRWRRAAAVTSASESFPGSTAPMPPEPVSIAANARDIVRKSSKLISPCCARASRSATMASAPAASSISGAGSSSLGSMFLMPPKTSPNIFCAKLSMRTGAVRLTHSEEDALHPGETGDDTVSASEAGTTARSI